MVRSVVTKKSSSAPKTMLLRQVRIPLGSRRLPRSAQTPQLARLPLRRSFHCTPARWHNDGNGSEAPVNERTEPIVSQTSEDTALHNGMTSSPESWTHFKEQTKQLFSDLWHDPWTALMSAPHEMFILVHELIPLWALSIPLATIALRLTVAFTTSQLNFINKLQLQNRHAFLQAYNTVKRQFEMQEKHTNFITVDKAGRVQVKAARSVQLRSWIDFVKLRYGGSSSRAFWVNMTNFPMWLLTIEALRSMAGTQYGLIGLVCHSLGLPVAPSGGLVPRWFEPSMATEGALWFTDLTASDPYGALSCVLGVAVAMAIHKSTASMRTPVYLQGRSRLHRFAIKLCPSLGLLLIPMTTQFPAALLLYWTTSSMVARLQQPIDELLTGPKTISSKVQPLQLGRDRLAPPTWLFEPSARSSSTRPRLQHKPVSSSPLGRGSRHTP